MIAKPLTTVVRHLRPSSEKATDGALLCAYVAERDEAAFAALVHRHAAMVLGACRRVLGDGHDAEDAMQAAFLVLARKASAVRPAELVGNWLYGVAVRTAMAARSRKMRIQKHEKQTAALPHPTVETKADLHELKQLVDDELSRLPDKYRAAVVMCELEGRSRQEASKQLQIAEGTLSSRLATARKILAKRFRQRGWAMAAAPLAVLFSQMASQAAVPHALLASAADTGAGASQLSANVVTLAEGVTRAMFVEKLKTLAVYVCTFLLIAGAGTMTALLAFGAGGTGQTKTIQNSQTNQIQRTETKQFGNQAGDENAQAKNVPSKPMAVDAFCEIHLKQGNAVIRQTGKETVAYDNNAIPGVKRIAKVEDGVLILKGSTPATKFIVEVKELSRLQIDGVGNVQVDDPKCKKLHLLVFGPAKVNLGGEVDEQIIDVRAGAYVDAQGCRAKQSKVTVAAGGRAIVYVSDKLNATVAAGGRVEYLGSPKIVKNVSLGGTFAPHAPLQAVPKNDKPVVQPPPQKKPADQPSAKSAAITLTAKIDGYTKAAMFNPQKYPFKYTGTSTLDAGQLKSLSKPGKISESTAKALLGCLLWPKKGDKLRKAVLKSDGKKLIGDIEVLHKYGEKGTHVLKMRIEGNVAGERITLQALKPKVSGSWNFGGGGSIKLVGEVKIVISAK